MIQCELNDNGGNIIRHAHQWLANTSQWDRDAVDQLINQIMEGLSLGKGKVMKPLRKGLTGYDSGPNLVECLALIPLETIKQHASLTLSHYANSTTPS